MHSLVAIVHNPLVFLWLCYSTHSIINQSKNNQDGAQPLHCCTAGQTVERTDPSYEVNGYDYRE